ncbi:hypothetical protein SAMN02799630_02578 [Paenibacillus sp. UNCCL117]|uniref:hypothetical protein n=1 Tax=unclassified Paenibacillus TaxID=185978 RepID=UPI00088E1F69|nr:MULTISPECIES: hypothetical protein [unclassified Paenibacillus]SDC06579.1 hypothetical protein SAMN04488602_101247 [Paenibacillus sp. cl123]SFW37850.1 hypothetical protein SAMN02799630_02578 [Paenibacillus sp. UNCCL117]
MKHVNRNEINTRERDVAELEDKKIIELILTHHAYDRWKTRVAQDHRSAAEIARFLWDRLKDGRIESYYRNEEDVFVVDGDLLMVVEFVPAEQESEQYGAPLYKLIAVTFLGCMSQSMELRDLKTYYSWLRHSRRMTLMKSSRKRK